MGAPFDFSFVFSFFPKLASTLGISLLIVAGSLVVGMLVGFLIALPRLYRIPALRTFSQVYVSFFRGTPILIQLFLFYYGLPEILKLIGIDMSKAPVLVFVILTYGLHTGAFMSEMIRASVMAVDRGQLEAAYAVGMTGRQAFTRIVLPQALAIAVPVFSNLVIALLKDTSLAFTLGVMEMTGKAQTLGSVTQHFIESYIALALIYLVVSFTLEKVLKATEVRLLRHELPDTPARTGFRIHKKGSYRRVVAGIGTEKGGAEL
ncbi:amino acid ABC transporter permease [Paenibacillus sp. VMFN-D1]|uniref:amino acid ABC transporter permease n=1 Tax=Paenibacillus sp. VMFN-D1 TaxID=2135608 RepID=UPI000E26D792|nr:amino acid ABC transporter permease [Paenibacillus sp. VMFN-D1]RED36393.1 L-cystine transport system permease protein [Paenibacillus sp. VMFN-D1]